MKPPVMLHYEKFASIIWPEFWWNTCKEYQKNMQNLKSILAELSGLFKSSPSSMSTHNIRKYGLIAITQIIGLDKLRKRWQRLPNKICFCVIIFGCFFLQSPSSGPTQPVCHLCWVLWQFSRCLLSSISIAFLSTGYPLKISLPNWYNCLWEFPN